MVVDRDIVVEAGDTSVAAAVRQVPEPTSAKTTNHPLKVSSTGRKDFAFDCKSW